MCPRCGYDQSGLVATWREAWPLEARCSECGFDYACEDAFRPGVRVHPWLYEHARAWSFGGWRAVRTWLMLLMPWWFWRSVTLAHRVSVARLVGWLAVVWFVPYLVAGVMFNVSLWVQLTTGRARAQPWSEALLADPITWAEYWLLLAGTIDRATGRFNWRFLDSWPVAAGVLVAGLGLPAVILALGHTRMTARARWPHVVRVGVYGFGWLGMAGFLLAFDATIQLLANSTRSPFWFGLTYNWWLHTSHYAIVGLGVWFCAYWYFALVRGLQLPRARLVWLAMMTIGVMVVLVVCMSSEGFVVAVWG